MDEVFDALELLIANHRDRVTQELLLRFREECRLLMMADAESRRSKMSADILNIARLKGELARFEYSYSLVKAKSGQIRAVEKMICSMQARIKTAIAQKNSRQKYLSAL